MQMNILAEGQGQNSSINDESIAAYYELRKENYLRPGRISFQHIYYNSSKRDAEPESYINDDLALLARSSADITEMGDPIMLERDYENVSEREISRNFGEDFAREVIPWMVMKAQASFLCPRLVESWPPTFLLGCSTPPLDMLEAMPCRGPMLA